MSDNILQSLQMFVQDVLAPDVRELKVRVAALEVRFGALESKVDLRFAALEQKMDIQFKAIMSALAELKAESELTTFRAVAALSERVAVLEAQRR